VDVRSRRDEEAYKHMKGPTTITVSFETEGGGGLETGTAAWRRSMRMIVELTSTEQVCDYTAETDDEDIKVSFLGDRLEEWFETDHAKRLLTEDRKPKGVRWSG